MKAQALTTLVLVTACLSTNTSHAERAPRSTKELATNASHVIKGTVLHQYRRTEIKGQHKYTYTIAEMSVQSVTKGKEIKTGDRLFVKYWNKAWLPGTIPLPGTRGMHSAPAVGESSEVYLEGDRKSGFEVLQPNGFSKITKP